MCPQTPTGRAESDEQQNLQMGIKNGLELTCGNYPYPSNPFYALYSLSVGEQAKMFESRRWQEAALLGCPTARTGSQGSLEVCQAFTQVGEDVTFKRQDRKNVIRKQIVIVQRVGLLSYMPLTWT